MAGPTLSGLISPEEFVIKNLFARSSGAPQENLTQIDAGTSGIQGRGNKVGLRMFSYFGRLNYSLSDKYLFEANLRARRFLSFQKGKKVGCFSRLFSRLAT